MESFSDLNMGTQIFCNMSKSAPPSLTLTLYRLFTSFFFIPTIYPTSTSHTSHFLHFVTQNFAFWSAVFTTQASEDQASKSKSLFLTPYYSKEVGERDSYSFLPVGICEKMDNLNGKSKRRLSVSIDS